MTREDFQHRYGPWALVAGASQGLGAEFAGQLAARGLNLALVARREDTLSALAGRLSAAYGIQTRILVIDLGTENAAEAVAAGVSGLDIGLLVYNAAYSAIGPFLNLSLEDHLREIQTNCQTPLRLAHWLGLCLLARGRGGILLMSSLSSLQGAALIANYAATKAYTLVLAEGVWEELRQQGIDVLACCAGATATENYQNSLKNGAKSQAIPAMPPQQVVRESLAALGKQPSVIPGRTNRLAAFFLRRLLPRSLAIRLMGRVLRGLYG